MKRRRPQIDIPEEGKAKQLGWDPGVATWLAVSPVQIFLANDEFKSIWTGTLSISEAHT